MGILFIILSSLFSVSLSKASESNIHVRSVFSLSWVSWVSSSSWSCSSERRLSSFFFLLLLWFFFFLSADEILSDAEFLSGAESLSLFLFMLLLLLWFTELTELRGRNLDDLPCFTK